MAFPCIRGHHVYDGILGPKSIVLDLGGHKGEFSSIIIKNYGCTCHVIEAMPELYEKIPQSAHLHTYHYAAGSHEGTLTFHVSLNPESNSIRLKTHDTLRSIEVPTISIPMFMKKHWVSSIDLLKMDIEGAEIDVFHGMDDELLKSITQITVEFHDFIPEMNMEQDVLKVIQRLKSIGFACIVFSRKSHFDVLFLNTAICSGYIIWGARITKYIHGFGRVLKRLLS